MNIFQKHRLKQQAKKIKQPEIRQAQLKSALNIEDQEQVIVVEKNNTIKFLVNAFSSLVRLAATLILFLLAFAGLVALVYPVPREALFAVLIDGTNRLMELIH